MIASGSEDCIVKIWDWEYGDCVKTLLSHSFAVWGLAVDDGENLASASWYLKNLKNNILNLNFLF